MSPTNSPLHAGDASHLLLSPLSDIHSSPYILDNLSGWSPASSSGSSTDLPLFSYPIDIDTKPNLSSPSTPSSDSSYLSFENSMNQALTAFPDESHISFPAPQPRHHEFLVSRQYADHQRVESQSNFYPMPEQSIRSSQHPVVVDCRDLTEHFSVFDPLPSQVNPQLGLPWENVSPMVDGSGWSRFKTATAAAMNSSASHSVLGITRTQADGFNYSTSSNFIAKLYYIYNVTNDHLDELWGS